MGSVGCFGQIENIRRQSLTYVQKGVQLVTKVCYYLEFSYIYKHLIINKKALCLIAEGCTFIVHITNWVSVTYAVLFFNFSENTQQAMFVVWFFSMIFMLMSGIFTPIASMPHWAEILTYANPIRYFADAMRSIFLKGAGLRDN